jgi:hypothetical protein
MKEMESETLERIYEKIKAECVADVEVDEIQVFKYDRCGVQSPIALSINMG